MSVRHIELVIERLSKSGDGVAPFEGRAVFVAGALPGDRVLAAVREEGKVLQGEIVELRLPSAERRPPVCPHAERCGGCDWMHLNDDAQVREKLEIVRSTLEHVGGGTIAAGKGPAIPARSERPLAHSRTSLRGMYALIARACSARCLIRSGSEASGCEPKASIASRAASNLPAMRCPRASISDASKPARVSHRDRSTASALPASRS